MATITTSQNINTVTYAAGEQLNIGLNSGAMVRLTIDAQVAADVTKIESFKLGSLASTFSSEVYFVNTSTTTPLIVTFNSQGAQFALTGYFSALKVRGAWISIGTGTGANDQTISTNIGGKSIDWPPFLEVESAAGSGVYVQMLNIQGNYTNDASVLPTKVTTFSMVGSDALRGAFFEYDELNRNIKFGNATGGWIPPTGANIRIPNIHFTAVGVPAAVAANRVRWMAGGRIDTEICSFSNRINGRFSQSVNMRLVNTNLPTGINLSKINESIYIRNVVVSVDVYGVETTVWAAPQGVQDIDGLKVIARELSTAFIGVAASGLIKNLTCYWINRTINYAFGLNLQQTIPGDTSEKRIEGLNMLGGGVSVSSLRNTVLKNYTHSDTLNGAVTMSSPIAAILLSGTVEDCVFQTLRKASGGAASRSALFNTSGGGIRGIAVHDIDYDGVGHMTNGFSFNGGVRMWVANGRIDNLIGSLTADGAPNAAYVSPSRTINVKTVGTVSATAPAGGGSSMMCGGPNAATGFIVGNSNSIPDAWNTNLGFGSTLTAAAFSFLLGSRESVTDTYTIAGVEGTDYQFTNNAFFALTTDCDAVFTSKCPIRGVTSMTGCTAPALPAGWVVSFRIRSARTGQDWPVGWSSWTAAAWTIAFNALTSYASNSGFDMQVRVQASSANTNSTSSVEMRGVTVDAAFAPTDVGFVEYAVSNGTPGATVAIIDTVGAADLRTVHVLGATGAAVLDYPHEYDNGTKRAYRLIARKVGFTEVVVTGAIGQAGAAAPIQQFAALSTTDADVAGIAVDGVAKSITVTGTKTYQEIYQKSQWWSVQYDNLIYNVPMSADDSSTFILKAGWTLVSDTMTSAATLQGGALSLGGAGTFTFSLASAILKMTPTAPGTYNLGASTFAGSIDLRNTTAHAITVQMPPGVTYTTANNTGGTITVLLAVLSQGLALTGLIAGSQVKIFTAGTQTELFTTSSSATSETWSQAGGANTTVDYTVMKAGYVPIRVTGIVVNSAVLATPMAQSVDRAYTASSGLTYGTTATVDTGTSRFTVTTATTVQNWYSFMIESWIAQSTLRNVAFPISSNGPNSFALEGWEFSAGVNLLKQDGLRYTSGGTATAIWAALYSVDTAAGLQIRYQQTDGGTTVDAANTGKIDQLVQVYGDAGHGNFDKRAYLVLKVQADGYDQAETTVTTTYGNLDDQLYVVGLNPLSNGLPTGAPTVNGTPTITDHGASPVTWHSKVYSVTITDSAAGNDGETLMRWIRYSLGLGGTFEGKDTFAWHDLVQSNGTSFKTVRGGIYGDTGAALKGVRVITNAGADHPDFNLHTADDGTTYTPPQQVSIAVTGVVAGSRVQIYDTANGVELLNSTSVYAYTEPYSIARTIRIRVAKQTGAAAHNFIEANAGSIGGGTYSLAYPVSQSADATYNTNAIDGSTVTGITITPSPMRVVINIAGGAVTWPQIYAYQVYWLATATGIADEAAFISAPDTANYLLTNFDIKNTHVTPLTITGGYGRDAVTGLVKDCIDTAGSTGNIFPMPDHAIPYSSGSGLTAGQAAQLAAVPDATTVATAVWNKTLP